MKVSSSITLLLCLFSSSFKSATARSVEYSLYRDHVDTVFQGLVQRQHIANETSDRSRLTYYVVSAGRIFKGCNFKNAETILIETSSDLEECGGVDFSLKKSYVFSGDTVPANTDFINSAAMKDPSLNKDVMVRVNSCALNTEFNLLSQTDKETLWSSTNICTKCMSTADCPGGIIGGSYYCDQNKCVAYDRPY